MAGRGLVLVLSTFLTAQVSSQVCTHRVTYQIPKTYCYNKCILWFCTCEEVRTWETYTKIVNNCCPGWKIVDGEQEATRDNCVAESRNAYYNVHSQRDVISVCDSTCKSLAEINTNIKSIKNEIEKAQVLHFDVRNNFENHINRKNKIDPKSNGKVSEPRKESSKNDLDKLSVNATQTIPESWTVKTWVYTSFAANLFLIVVVISTCFICTKLRNKAKKQTDREESEDGSAKYEYIENDYHIYSNCVKCV